MRMEFGWIAKYLRIYEFINFLKLYCYHILYGCTDDLQLIFTGDAKIDARPKEYSYLMLKSSRDGRILPEQFIRKWNTTSAQLSYESNTR